MFEEKVNFAKKWFKDNNVQVPSGTKEWSKCSVKAKQVPPGCTYQTLKRNNINLSDFIAAITNSTSKAVAQNPICKENCEDTIGLIWLAHETIKNHKKVKTMCISCLHTETLDYGTLTRMRTRKNKYCRLCRGVGGKQKPLSVYNKFIDFRVVSFIDNNIQYSCNKCNNIIVRCLDYCKSAEYLVCDLCYPVPGAKIRTDLGVFHSKIEYEVYKYLISVLPEQDIVYQIRYSELFNEITSKHTADFYLIPYDIVLEVTTKTNNLKSTYEATLEGKARISSIIKVVRSVQQVKDIVRPLLKDNG